MILAHWATLAGVLLIFMALTVTVVARLPLSGSIIYLAVGLAVSPLLLHMAAPEAVADATVLEHLTEIVVLVSLFTSGLKMSSPLGDLRWALPVRLATLSMLVTVGLVTLLGVWLMALPFGAAILLGGILAPTDPVLASDVQLAEPSDRDKLRFALTGEGGLNDGTAFPVVMLGLGLLGLHDLGDFGWRWLAVDVVWASAAGLAVGALLGSGIGMLVLHLRLTHQTALGLDNFIALGLVMLAYGLALEVHAYGFLAVFAAGFAFRRVERRDAARSGREGSASAAAAPVPAQQEAGEKVVEAGPVDPATHALQAGAFMAHAVLSFNEQIERIGEVVVVIAVGALLWAVDWSHASWPFVALLLFGVRPLAVVLGLFKSSSSGLQRGLIGWFGIRGIGSLYYLSYAINHGLPGPLAEQLVTLTLSVVVASVVLHGVSVTPLMLFYARLRR